MNDEEDIAIIFCLVSWVIILLGLFFLAQTSCGNSDFEIANHIWEEHYITDINMGNRHYNYITIESGEVLKTGIDGLVINCRYKMNVANIEYYNVWQRHNNPIRRYVCDVVEIR